MECVDEHTGIKGAWTTNRFVSNELMLSRYKDSAFYNYIPYSVVTYCLVLYLIIYFLVWGGYSS